MAKKLLERYSALVVDDSGTARSILVGLLDELGIKSVKVLSDGNQVVPHLEIGNRPSFILLDWTMRDMHGIDVLKAIRNHDNPKIKSIPIIMVTAEAKKDNIVDAIKAGITGYVTKPFTGAILEERIKKVLKLS